jgi:hypothetical protein
MMVVTIDASASLLPSCLLHATFESVPAFVALDVMSRLVENEWSQSNYINGLAPK